MTGPGATPDVDRLLGAAVEEATRLLSEAGEFYPFALALTTAGEVVRPAVDPGTTHPTAAAVEELLLAQLTASRDALRAVAVVSDVRLQGEDGSERSAIRIEVETRTGEPLSLVVPYADRRLDQPVAVPGQSRVF